MKVTLKDIAQESGYSISTVSRVLNGSGKISKDVQLKIVEVAEKLNYPFVKSRIPIYSNGSLRIASVIDFRQGEFFSSFFFGISEAARESNIQLSLIDVVDYEDNLVKTINNLNDQTIDGICLFLPEMDSVDYRSMQNKLNTNIPIVSNTMTQTPFLPTITFDGLSGGHLAADYFVKKGYNSFGIIKGPFELAEARFRFNGFRDNLKHYGYDLIMEADGNFMFQSGVEAFYKYQKLKKKPEAIFASNDYMLKGFMETAKVHGYKIPDDVALIGYDNTPMCEESYPKITTICTDFIALGLETFKVLKDIIGKQHSQNGTLNLVPVSLIERETA